MTKVGKVRTPPAAPGFRSDLLHTASSLLDNSIAAINIQDEKNPLRTCQQLRSYRTLSRGGKLMSVIKPVAFTKPLRLEETFAGP